VREIRVPKRTLDDILAEAGVETPDFVSIDVEGHELEVLKGFFARPFRPRIRSWRTTSTERVRA
jgi:FkbM family methyltransferase